MTGVSVYSTSPIPQEKEYTGLLVPSVHYSLPSMHFYVSGCPTGTSYLQTLFVVSHQEPIRLYQCYNAKCTKFQPCMNCYIWQLVTSSGILSKPHNQKTFQVLGSLYELLNHITSTADYRKVLLCTYSEAEFDYTINQTFILSLQLCVLFKKK